jgi:hypothetical protein
MNTQINLLSDEEIDTVAGGMMNVVRTPNRDGATSGVQTGPSNNNDDGLFRAGIGAFIVGGLIVAASL